jgi:hypothetical protein
MRIYFFQPNAESRNFHGAKQSRFPQRQQRRSGFTQNLPGLIPAEAPTKKEKGRWSEGWSSMEIGQ